MNLAEIKRLANITIAELSDGYTVPSPIQTRHINHGYRILNNVSLFSQASLSITTTNGTQSYSLPADYLYIRDVYWKGLPLTWVPLKYLNRHSSATISTPINYSISEGTIYFDPIPNDTGSFISGRYYSAPSNLTAATDSPTFPEAFHDYLVDYAIYEGLLLAKKGEAAQVYKSRFDDGVTQLTAFYEKDRSRDSVALLRAQAVPWSKGKPQ